jgi:hypothetical protein
MERKVLLFSSVYDKINSIVDELEILEIKYKSIPYRIPVNDDLKIKIRNRLYSIYYIILNRVNYDNISEKQGIKSEAFKNHSISTTIDGKQYRIYYSVLLSLLENNFLIRIDHSYWNVFSNVTNTNDKHLSYTKKYGLEKITDLDFNTYDMRTDKNVNGFAVINLDLNLLNEKYVKKKKFDNDKKLKPYQKYIDNTYMTSIDMRFYIQFLMKNVNKKIGYDKKGNIKYLTIERINSYINRALLFNNKNFYFTIADYGRFYSSITEIPSIAHPFLYFNDENRESQNKLFYDEIFGLISYDDMFGDIYEQGMAKQEINKEKKWKFIDVVNCQPLLLAALIKNDEYKKDVEQGVFYDKLARALHLVNPQKEYNRETAKLYSYKYIFFKAEPFKTDKGIVYKALNSMYGKDFVKQLDDVRLKAKDGVYKKNNLAVLLQHLEANIFVEKFKFSSFPCLTKHDCLIVQEENVEEADTLIKKYFIEEYGLKVQTRIE